MATLCDEHCPPAKKLKVDTAEAGPSGNDLKEEKKQSKNGSINGKEKHYDETVVDNEYFDSYADVEVHRTMIEDQVRTDSYHQAIMQSPSFIKDKVVVDVGCGSGILSLFCAQAGAKKVYAIDASQIARLARKVVAANGFENIITVIEGKAEDVELPEKVDVVVSEWMGHMLLYETMLPSVLHIRDKYLKPGGQMFPERAVMKIAMGETNAITRYEEGTYDFWVSLHPQYGLEMSTIADTAVSRYRELAHLWVLPQCDVASDSCTFVDLDLNTITPKELEKVSCSFKLKSMGSRQLNCLVVWFDVMFPGDITLTTSPHCEETHWQQTVLPLPEIHVDQDTELEGDMVMAQHKKRSLDISLKYKVKGKEFNSRFRLDEHVSEVE